MATSLSGIAEPLPAVSKTDAVFMTVWFILFFLFSLFYLGAIDKWESDAKWTEFTTVMLGSSLLTLWYLMEMIDRWIHFNNRIVNYGYVAVLPFFNFARIASTLLLLWATYKITWRELNTRLPPESGVPKAWWFAGRFAITITGLMSLYCWMSYLAVAGSWLNFLSLDIVSRVATTWAQLDLVMNLFFFLFSTLTLIEVTAFVAKARHQNRSIKGDRVAACTAALILFARSTVEFAIAAQVYRTHTIRRNFLLVLDVTYGLTTFLYLFIIYIVADRVTGQDEGGPEAIRIEAWIRYSILDRLHQATNRGRQQPPPFDQFLSQAESHLNEIVQRYGRSNAMTEKVGRKYIAKLRGDYQDVDLDQPWIGHPSRQPVVTRNPEPAREARPVYPEPVVAPDTYYMERRPSSVQSWDRRY